MDSSSEDLGSSEAASLVRRHLVVGWWSIFAFVSLGLVLEALHGFKVDYLLDVRNETRRFMWTLAHAHGTLLGFLNLAMSFTLRSFAKVPAAAGRRASGALLVASLMVPIGFFLGGIDIRAGDPGLGILLVPPGGLFLLYGLFEMARLSQTGSPRGDADQ